MKRKLSAVIAVIVVVCHVTYSVAVAPLALAVLSFGARSLWAAGGVRMLSMLLRVAPAVGSVGVQTGARTAWYVLSQSAPGMAAFGAKMLMMTGVAAVGTALLQNWDAFATSVAAEFGWVKLEDGKWYKVVDPTFGYQYTDNRAFVYYPQYMIDYGFTQYAPPNILTVEGIWATQTEANAAATLKYNAVLADTATYNTVSAKMSGINDYVAYGTRVSTAVVAMYYFRAYKIGEAKFYSWHFFYPDPGGINVLIAQQPQTRPLTQDEIAAALAAKIAAADPKARAVVEAAEKAANGVLAAGTDPDFEQWLKDWVLNAAPTAADDVAADGEPASSDEALDRPKTQPSTLMRQKVSDRFGEFVGAMKETSLGGLYNNMFGSVPTSGTCEMTVDMGQTFGGIQTVSFCEWASWLSILASVLTISSGYVAVRIITRGGGGG